MSENADIIDAFVEKFDALRETYIDADSLPAFLLIKSEFQSSGYSVRLQLTSGHYFYFSEYYNSFILKYATPERSFTDVADTITHIANGGIIYEIPPESRVVIFPNGKKPYFQFFCRETMPRELFTL